MEVFDSEEATKIPEGSTFNISCLDLSMKNFCSISLLNEFTVRLFMLTIMSFRSELNRITFNRDWNYGIEPLSYRNVNTHVPKSSNDLSVTPSRLGQIKHINSDPFKANDSRSRKEVTISYISWWLALKRYFSLVLRTRKREMDSYHF